MEFNLNRPLLDQDPSAKALIALFRDAQHETVLQGAIIYHNFPLYRDAHDSSSKAHVLLVSPASGVIVFECSPERNAASAQLLGDQVDQTSSQVFARLIKSKKLRAGPQKLIIPFKEAVFLPNLARPHRQTFTPRPHITICSTLTDIQKLLEKDALSAPLNEDSYNELIAILEGSTGILSPRPRKLSNKTGTTKGKILAEIEVAIANFDQDQKRAALNIVDGAQRIRGLAGSGKTVILTWKTALIHLQNPDARIIYTYYTKSLYGLIKRLITRFYRHYAERDPNWDNIRILHAWGGQNLPGVYSTICAENRIVPITYSEAKDQPLDPFNYVCSKLLNSQIKRQFDYTIIDEGQDFPRNFYRICYSATVNGRVIWGYDECQNILDIEIQDPRETFGRDESGQYLIDFDETPPGTENDIVLHRCYRNPREVLIYAFALGLGLYNDPILQMPENNDHWQDLGFNVLEGSSKEGNQMVVERPEDNTPLVMNKSFSGNDSIRVSTFSEFKDEVRFVVDAILEDLRSELVPEDILVISLDDRAARYYFRAIAAHLAQHKVQCFNLLEAPSVSRRFTVHDAVTLSTVYRAKGNEVGSAYIVGVDAVFAEKDSIRERNKLFSAMTRAKGWLMITGCGADAHIFRDEFSRVQADYPYFRFTMPDRATLKTFQRDLSTQHAQLHRVQVELEKSAKMLGVSQDTLLEMMRKSKQKSIGRKKDGK